MEIFKTAKVTFDFMVTMATVYLKSSEMHIKRFPIKC